MGKPHPKKFRDDVVAVARTGQAPLAQIAKDFGSSEGSLTNWLKRADVEDGHRPGLTDAERAELRDLKRRNRLLEHENEVLRRAATYLSQANLPGNSLPARPRDGHDRRPHQGAGRGGVQVLGLSTQGYYKWLAAPVSNRDWADAHAIELLLELHADEPTLGYRSSPTSSRTSTA